MSERNEQYQFVSTDAEAVASLLITAYEKMTGVTVLPASPENLFIRWVANIIIQERAQTNYVGNQNIPSRAAGENLDALGELFYAVERPKAQAAVATMRMRISAPQTTSILIPAGTRVTDVDSTLYWETTEDAYVPIGSEFVDVPIKCQTAGTVGNGWVPGQINTLVDVYDYYSSCDNITTSDGGAPTASDDEYYELMRLSMDGYSCAGARGGYYYFAKQVSTEIEDVLANQPEAGCVAIYVLMDDGTIATAETKAAVLAACSAETVRPLTDLVTVEDAEEIDYDIDLTYYIKSEATRSAADIEADVATAVNNYVSWQSARFGRDINPDKLREFLLGVDGVKRVNLVSPAFTVLRNGMDNTVPQIAKIGTKTITNGGYEDE